MSREPRVPAAGAFFEQWNKVWVVSAGKLWRWRWDAEPFIISWQDNNVPCCLSFFLFFYTFFRGDSALRVERTKQGGIMCCMIVKTVCSRSNEYFWRALPLFFPFFLSYYSLQVLSEVLLCMLLCERKGVSQNLFICAWIQIIVLEEED